MRIERVTGSVLEFHARQIPSVLNAPEVWHFIPDHCALVLGSSQDESTADQRAAAAAGIQVVRRRSGGGAVYVDPLRCLWLDVVLPRKDPRWSDDVRAATLWLGHAWTRALAATGLDATLHEGGLERTPWGRLVCFAALGPGEVLIDGRKVVGISQRRTKDGARFQCIVYDRWDPYDVLDLLDLSPDDRLRAAGDLTGLATGVGARIDALRDAVLHELVGI